MVVMGPEPPVTDPAQLATLVNMDPGKLGDLTMTSVFHPLIQDMKVRQLSNALKHAAAIQYIAAQDYPSDSWHLVLEDDAMIVDAAQMIRACTSAPKDADMLFLGFPSTDPHQSVNGEIRYDPFLGITLIPSCEAYALRMQTARFLSSSVLPIRFRTEIHISWLIATTAITTYVTSPNLSVDGSKVGMFVSTIESNNTLCFNSDYQLLNSSATNTDSELDTFVSRCKSMSYADHPDVKVLLATRLASAGRYDDAMSIFSEALDVYSSEGAVVGNDSTFMKVYMDLFKHRQADQCKESPRAVIADV